MTRRRLAVFAAALALTAGAAAVRAFADAVTAPVPPIPVAQGAAGYQMSVTAAETPDPARSQATPSSQPLTHDRAGLRSRSAARSQAAPPSQSLTHDRAGLRSQSASHDAGGSGSRSDG